MITNTNKSRGNTGVSLAIAFYGANGYTVSIPINDTQDYDLIIDSGNKISRVQAKFSTQRSEHGVQKIPLRSLGGTNGGVYKTLVDTDIDIVFCANPDMEMWSIPKEHITQRNVLNLGKKYDQFRVQM